MEDGIYGEDYCACRPDYKIFTCKILDKILSRKLCLPIHPLLMSFARKVKPYAIINCAAHTGVDACETECDKAYKINAIGARNLSIAAVPFTCSVK